MVSNNVNLFDSSPLKGNHSWPINSQTKTNFSVREFNTIREFLNIIRGANNTPELFSVIVTKNKKGDRVILLGIQSFLEDQIAGFKPIAEFIDPDGNPDHYYEPIQGFDQSNCLLNGFTLEETREWSEQDVEDDNNSSEPWIEPETCGEGRDGTECEPEWNEDQESWICNTCGEFC